MDDVVLVINAGSSSLKFCVYNAAADGWRLNTRGQIEGIGSAPRFSARDDVGVRLADEALDRNEVHDGGTALAALASWLRSHYHAAHVLGVGHRVVHGGARFTGPTLVTPGVVEELRALIPLAPLHQPHNLAAIEAVSDRLPHVPQVACFDTAFHRGQPEIASVVPLPRDICGAGVQRYGFHGLSYEYIASVLPQVAPEIADGRVVVAHLGSGASLCAMKQRRSIDSTLGFTALDGLCMGTRPGALDPGVVLYLFQSLWLSARDVETILYKKSGLLGISGISNDMRELTASTAPSARLAVEYFVYRAVKEIGALAAVLGGIDGLVFTAGIGENSPEIRRRICEGSAWLGLEVDGAANDARSARISRARSRVSAWVIPTNEELIIARHTGAVLGLTQAQV
jgi:acetate kinase